MTQHQPNFRVGCPLDVGAELERHRPRLLPIVEGWRHRFPHLIDHTDEVINAIYVVAIARVREYPGQPPRWSSPLDFLRHLTNNLLRNLERQYKYHMPFPSEEEPNHPQSREPPPFAAVIAREDRARGLFILRKLPRKYLLVIKLRIKDEWTMKAIAAHLGISLAQAYRRYHFGLSLFQTLWGEEGGHKES